MKRRPLFVSLGLAAAVAFTAHAGTDQNEIYAGAGTTGATVGYGYALGSHMAVRIEGNYLNVSHSISIGSSKYEGSLKFRTFGLYYDFVPLGPFRLTGGVLVGANKFVGTDVVKDGTVTINHQRYDATGQWVKATIDFKSTSPYLGIGLGHHPERGGLGFFSDLGLIYGRPTAIIAVSEGLHQAAGSANIAADQASLQRKVNHLRFFPVLRMGLDFQW